MRFLCDGMHGRLARTLRMLGFDAAYAAGAPDDQVLARASAESRRLLTRDRQLAQVAGGQGIYVASLDPDEQLRQVLDESGARPPGFLTRCMECNEALVPVAPDDVADRLPESRRGEPGPLRRCRRCDRLYWHGSHVEAMRKRFFDLLEPGT